MIKNLEDLDKLLDTHGQPNALIDNFNADNGFAIWGYKNIFKSDLENTFLNNTKIQGNQLHLLQNQLDKWLASSQIIGAIGFVSYEIKNLLYPHIKFKISNTKHPCLWFAQPNSIRKYKFESTKSHKNKSFLKLEKDIDQLPIYEKLIFKIKEELKRGNSYQINLTMPKLFSFKNITPFEIYLAIRECVHPPYGYFIDTGKEQIMSFSPEQFFQTDNNIIKTFPMKGTRPRMKDLSEDVKMKDELSNSEKDRAEHLMIVDLLRNDIGKICNYGSVKVKDLFKINSYATVHQMVSCVYGELKNNVKYIDILKALCPGGSITGAPKESSMKIIDSLESYDREIYTGGIGYIDQQSNMYFNIAIRTMIAQNDILNYSVGGGIVWDSIASQELDEAHLKSKILDKFIKN